MHSSLLRSTNTVEPDTQAFAVWITGLPASGKSTVAAALHAELACRGIDTAILESDALRPILTPHPRYDQEERDDFYRALVYIGVLLTRHGVPVIFDATANLRAYRESARKQLSRFLEVFVDTPLDVCMRRDPKGIYRQALEGGASTVPGFQAPYEAPEHPDVIVQSGVNTLEGEAREIVSTLLEKKFI